MKSDMFQQPVRILVGLGFPVDVLSVMDAYRQLVDWPAFSRDAAHCMALKACLAGLRGEVEPETVRGLFVAFAEKHHILASAMSVHPGMAFVPTRAAVGSGPGRVA